MDIDKLKDWWEAKKFFEEKFGEDQTIDSILFLIGIQELGKGFKKFTKDQKLDIIHIAVCTLLEPYGYYTFEGNDNDGWPHFSRNTKLPNLKGMEQEKLIKEAIVNYTRTIQQSGNSSDPL